MLQKHIGSISIVGCFTLAFLLGVPAFAATIQVPTVSDSNVNGQNLANAISSAQLGDTIVLQNGATYNFAKGNTVSLTNKGTGTGADADYITIEPADMSNCPAEGARVNPQVHASTMPKLTTTDGLSPIVTVQAYAHHWKLVCLEITDAIPGPIGTVSRGNWTAGTAYNPGDTVIYNEWDYVASRVVVSSVTPDLDKANWDVAADVTSLVNNGGGSGASGYLSYSEMNAIHNITLDRLFVHPHEVTPSNLYPAPATSAAVIGIYINGQYITISNSWIGGFSSHWPEGAGIAVGTDVGSYVMFSNNELGGLFNNMQIGFSEMINPANSATMSGGTAATYTPGSGSATLSNASNLQVGDYAAFQIDMSNCPGLSSTYKCWGTVAIDSINASTGAVTYHAIGPSPNQVGWINALLITPISGGQVAWNGLQANHMTVIRNHFYKPFSWQAAYPSVVKNFIEQKSCVACLIEGNIFEGSHDGDALELHNESPGLGSVWATFKDETWRNNLYLSNASTIAALLLQITETNTPGQNFTFTNNLFVAFPGWSPPLVPGSPCANGCQNPVFITMGGQNISITHNTIVGRGANSVITAPMGGISGGQTLGSTNTVFKDNIVDYGSYGFGNNVSGPDPYKLAWPPNGIITGGNVVPNPDMASWCCPGPNPTGPGYFSSPTDHVVSDWSKVGLLDFVACHGMADQPWLPNTPPPSSPYTGDYAKCALGPSSPYKGTATDGKDPGVDMAALQAALAGNTITPPPPPPLPPTPPPPPPPLVCGNGITETGEQCDNGGANGVCPSTCSTSCTLNVCSTNPPLPPAPPPPPPPPQTTKFIMGDRVIVTTSKLNVRATPGGKNLGFHKLNAQGTVVGGPVTTKGYTWWKINYDSNPDGWSAQDWLAKVTSAFIPNGPTISGAVISPFSPQDQAALIASIQEQIQILIHEIEQLKAMVK